MGSVKGTKALVELAPRFPQLYVAPLGLNEAEYRRAAERGIAPENASLAHFIGSVEDELRVVDTPTGPVEALFLREREDFECFLSIMRDGGRPTEYDPIVRSLELRGLLDWGRVRRERAAYLERGGVEWDVEFERLAARTRAFKSDLVVYTDGPYSDVPAGRVSFEDDEWIEASRKIRLYHECARVVLRREEPDAIYPIWSEIVGDAVGLIATTGSYDVAAAAQLLGVTPECYSGGKLVRQLGGANIQDVDRVARDVYAVLLRVEAYAAKVVPSRPLDLAVKYAHEPYLRF
jgi:hypothetical protein